jgi:hypothetical protein
MLRLIVLVLLLLNAVYFAWGQGWLLLLGFGPTQQSEPQRLAQQIRPEAIELLSEKELVKEATAASASSSVVCLQSDALDESQADAVKRVVQASLPEGAWVLDAQPLPERWIIYMGKYANTADLEKKRAQLANMHLTFEPLEKPELAPGLSLGAFSSQGAADTALAALALRGVRTARVLQELPARPGYQLRLPAVDASVQKQLDQVKAVLPGKSLEPCSSAASAVTSASSASAAAPASSGPQASSAAPASRASSALPVSSASPAPTASR